MKDLKIKIGDFISRPSEVIFIKVPENAITQSVFSIIRSANAKKVNQLIIRQLFFKSSYEPQEEFEVPDGLKDLNEQKTFLLVEMSLQFSYGLVL